MVKFGSFSSEKIGRNVKIEVVIAVFKMFDTVFPVAVDEIWRVARKNTSIVSDGDSGVFVDGGSFVGDVRARDITDKSAKSNNTRQNKGRSPERRFFELTDDFKFGDFKDIFIHLRLHKHLQKSGREICF